jgi:hypothetical protein
MFMVWVALPVAAIGLALRPARRMAGASKGRWFSHLGSTLLSYIAWLLFALLGGFAVAAAGDGPMSFLIAGGFALVIYAGGAYVLGEAMRGGTPLSSRFSRRLILVGLGVGGAGLAVEGAAAIAGARQAPGAVVATILWLLGPPTMLYVEAVAARRRFRRYMSGDCARCGRRGGSLGAICPGCEAPPPRLCHRCRRFVSVPLGQACPSCAATIGRRCWRCQYDWTGATGRCPECGVWKPDAESADELEHEQAGKGPAPSTSSPS